MDTKLIPELHLHGAAPDAAIWRVSLADEAATERLASEIAAVVGAGDLVALSGELGAGKTTFARELIRSIRRDPGLVVPSPTFALMQTYDGSDFPIAHFDLYRIEKESELAELGWEEATDGALVLVEWPERAGEHLASDRLEMLFRPEGEAGLTHRSVVLRGIGSFGPRLVRAKAVHEVLQAAGWEGARRTFMLGDASTRAYERLARADGATAILMFLPPRPRAPAVRHGKSYSEIARLSHNIDAFIAMDEGLRARGLSAPEIYAADRKLGLAILEDLGNDGVVDAAGPMPERYAEAAALLAHLHGLDLPATLSLGTGENYTIPPYDREALLIEVELILEWYAPHVAGVRLPASTRSTFVAHWSAAIEELTRAAATPTWTLRDYHSPNLIWLDPRQGLARLGLIDFQDCVLGPPSYDVAALLQDARVTVPEALELRLLGQYAQLRRRTDESFDTAAFARAYAIAGAQRATKVLGLFTRLDRRDGKPHYLEHLPRVERYLAKNLGHPVLADLKAWYEAHLPRVLAPPP